MRGQVRAEGPLEGLIDRVMTTIHFRITAKERLVLSRTSATAGLHECLDFIPGSVLLGSVAAEFYPKWKGSVERGQDLFDLFHSGAVSFGDAHPQDGTGSATLPVPLSLHHAKPRPGFPSGHLVQDHGRAGKRLVADKVLNLAAASLPDDVQWQQLRTDWVSPDGSLHEVKLGHVVKTARDTGRLGAADEGRLFGFSYIEAGQAFVGSILIDGSRQGLSDMLREWIGDGREIHVGRSHRAEFGCCLLEVVPGTSSHDDDAGPHSLPERLVVFATSDWWLSGGLPVNGADLHPQLEGYRLVPSKTFARFRRYAAWNSFRGFPDPERQVVSRGSVVTLERHSGAGTGSLAMLREEIERDGIGAGRCEGLGRALINPALLASVHPTFQPQARLSEAKALRIERPDNAYLPAIEDRWTRTWTQVARDRLADTLAGEWAAFGNPRPRKSQWATLRIMARNAAGIEEFLKVFKDYTQKGAAKHKWSGTSRGLGEETLAGAVLKVWDLHKSTVGGEDPRGKNPRARETVFLAAITEAARRMRDR